MELCIFDLATLRYRRTGTGIAVCSRAGEELGHADSLPGGDDRLAAWSACEDALARGRVRRSGRSLRVAFYNPHSGEVSVGAGVRNRSYCDRAALAISMDGTAAAVSDDTVEVDGRQLPATTPDMSCLTGLIAA